MGATVIPTGGTLKHDLPPEAPPVNPAARPVKGAVRPEKGRPVEELVKYRIGRGEVAVRRQEARWRELWAHFDGDQYVERTTVDSGSLVRVETREGGSKPRWRPRLVRNRFTKAIMGEVSVVASRVPSWEVTPLAGDLAQRNRARLAERVLVSLGQKLKFRQVTFRVCQIAAVTGDGYLFPCWDPTVGKAIVANDPIDPDQDGYPDTGGVRAPAGTVPVYTGLRTGEIDLKVLRQDQVMWQPNQSFEQSRWHCVRDAQPLEEVKERVKNLLGVDAADNLGADATTAVMELRDGDGKADLIFVYHYLERPSDSHPGGRYLCIAGGLVLEAREYPINVDMPVIHRMPWILRENRDRSLGIGEQAIDIQRSINRIVNQLVQWRNLCLVPQMLARRGSIKTVVTDEPGIVIEYTGNDKPEWRVVPEIPVSLFKDLEQAYADLDYVVGGSSELPAGITSGTGIAGVNEREQSFRAQVISNLSTWYADVGRHLLCLVRQHYTEERLLLIQGRFGAEMIPDFLGEQLGDDDFGDVRVSESSITPRTRAEMEAKITMFADKQWIPPQMAMAALQGGIADTILDRFELDINKAHRHISQLIAIGQANPAAGAPIDPALLPMAGPMDNHEVQMDEISEWMKTVDYENQHPLVKQAAMALLAQHQQMIEQKLMQDAQRAALTAAAQGMGNAAAPQTPGAPSSEPSKPSLESNANAIAGAGG